MNEIDYFKFFLLYSDDVTANVNYLHIKKIYFMNFSYIVIDDLLCISYFIDQFKIVASCMH
jgi:hypothetical protein